MRNGPQTGPLLRFARTLWPSGNPVCGPNRTSCDVRLLETVSEYRHDGQTMILLRPSGRRPTARSKGKSASHGGDEADFTARR